MICLTPVFQSHSILFTKKTRLQAPPSYSHSLPILGHDKHFFPRRGSVQFQYSRRVMPKRAANVDLVSAASPVEDSKSIGFVDELRSSAMRLRSKQPAKEGQKEVKQPHEWEPTFDGILKFLVNCNLVYDTLEGIIQDPAFPYVELRNTGRERSERLAKGLESFRDQGHVIPEPSNFGVGYARYLKKLSKKDHRAILCHFYNLYIGHTAGGQIMGKRLSEKILKNKELQFYKWDDDVSQLLQNATDKLNTVAESWRREEKNRCLGETQKSFKYEGDIFSLILS